MALTLPSPDSGRGNSTAEKDMTTDLERIVIILKERYFYH